MKALLLFAVLCCFMLIPADAQDALNTVQDLAPAAGGGISWQIVVIAGLAFYAQRDMIKTLTSDMKTALDNNTQAINAVAATLKVQQEELAELKAAMAATNPPAPLPQ